MNKKGFNRKRLLNLGRILISVVIVGWLVYVADSNQLVSRLAEVNPYFLLLMALIVTFDRHVMALKWNMLLRAKGVLYPWWSAVGSYYRAGFFGIFLPTVGADSVRIVEVSQVTGKTDEVVASIAVERLFGMLATAALGFVNLLIFIWFIGADNDLEGNVFILFAILIAGISLLLASMNRRFLAFILNRIPLPKWKIMDKLTSIIEAYQSYADHPRTLALFLLFTIFEQLIPSFSTFYISEALGLEIDLIYFILFIPLILLIVRLPVTFEGFGLREGLFVYFFSFIGVPTADSLLLSVLFSVLWQIASAPFMIYYFWTGKSKPTQLSASS
ncbi:MAG: lysylphosphatidylglycerol synthase transmembrane domain-containing protein [Anaerolineae bacterium]